MSSSLSPAALARAGPLKNGLVGFVVAWGFCLLFYFGLYALRSAPGVMAPELTATFGLTTLGVSSLLGLYYYTYSTFAIVAGASLDRLGAKYVIPAGIVVTAVGSLLFGLGSYQTAELGRLLQGAGAAFAFTGAVYLASHGFSAAYLATAIGFTQVFGMLGGSAGQFAVGPLSHGVIAWQQFWLVAGAVLLVVSVIVLVATPARHDPRPATAGRSWLSMFKPYKTVLTNPQSYLCGFTAGLLFLPTTIGDMIWGVPFLRDGLGVGYAEAVNRASKVPLGWVIGCPLLGYIADRIGRRKLVLIGGSVLMLATICAGWRMPARALSFCRRRSRNRSRRKPRLKTISSGPMPTIRPRRRPTFRLRSAGHIVSVPRNVSTSCDAAATPWRSRSSPA